MGVKTDLQRTVVSSEGRIPLTSKEEGKQCTDITESENQANT